MKSSHLTQEELNQIQQTLQQNLQETVQQIQELKLQDPFQNPDHAIDNADPGSESFDEDGHDRVQAQLQELDQEKALIEKALTKMADGSYGICEKTGQEIPKERLFAMPTATTVVGV